MDTAVIGSKPEKLVRIGEQQPVDEMIHTVYLGPAVGMVTKRVVDSYDPAKWKYPPEPDCLDEWKQSEA